MRPWIPWSILFVLTASWAGNGVADSEWEDLEQAALCALASDEARIELGLNRAVPGQLVPGFQPHRDELTVDTCVVSGGSVTFRNLDFFIRHVPVSANDVFHYTWCFHAGRDLGHGMQFLEEYQLHLRYNAALGLVFASLDGGTTYVDCPLAADEMNPAWAEVPWFSYLHTAANGVILVLAEP